MNNTPDVIVLCGGAGLRLRSVVADVPKAMARIGDRPFLELLLEKLDRSGFRRVILATGYQGDAICNFFGSRFRTIALLYSRESMPLGTGGALRNAAELVKSDAVIVTNGDSYTEANLTRFVLEFQQAKAEISVLVVCPDGRKDCGTVAIKDDGSLSSFSEKNCVQAEHYINAGIYMISRERLHDMPKGVQLSLEHEVLPRWIRSGVTVRSFIHRGACLDIGTPKRYRRAQDLLQNA